MPRMLLNAKKYYEHQKRKPKLLKKYHIKKNNKPVSSMIKTPGAQLVYGYYENQENVKNKVQKNSKVEINYQKTSY